jgi:flagellar motility protein MotE (MotC chaperone)
MRYERGGAMVAILCLLVGVALGLAAGVAPRFFKLDPMKYVKPDLAYQYAEKTEPEVEDPNAKLPPSEVKLRQMIADVQKQRAALEEREKPLLAREQEVANQKNSLAMLKSQIEQAEIRIKQQQVEQDEAEAKNIKRLAKIWSTMEPAQAAKMVTTVDPELAARVIYSMSDEVSAPIFTVLVNNAETEVLTANLMESFKRLKPAPKPETR